MTTSSMWLGDTTNIDYSYINECGQVIGGSIRPKFEVTGKVDPVEQVVVDFSTIKKAIKNLIDDPKDGFDHKLWWIDGLSYGTIKYEDGQVFIKTPCVEISGPENIVRRFTKDHEDEICDYLESHLNEMYPGVDVQIGYWPTYTFDVMPSMNTSTHKFRYVHGLRESTSWGCQNIAHGHLSYLAAETYGDPLQADMLLSKIAADLDNTVFIWEDNHVSPGQIAYHCSRGNMQMILKDQKSILINTESTVEHLVDYVAHEWEEHLKAVGVKKLFVSEGLSKGACVKF